VTACYRLAGTGGGAGGVEGLELTYEARATAPTPVNLTNHTYWNLGGDGAGTILDHECTLRCSRYLPVDTELIPTGEIAVVDGTPMDFTRPHRFGERIGRTAGGYDHCFLVDGPIVEGTDAAGLRPALLAHDPKSGRSMEVLTTQPAIQLYTGNFLDGIAGRDGHVYVQHSGFCVEPEGLPDAVNRPSFPSPILLPGQTYRHTTIYRFSVGKE